jgi:SAM-dependent methyltransferase
MLSVVYSFYSAFSSMPLHTCSTTPVENCEICHGDRFTQVGSKDRGGLALRTVICEDCGLVFSDPRPNSQEIDDFYRESYRVAYKQAWQPRLKHTYRAGKVAEERLDYLMPLLAPGRTICDFGSGGGELVFILRELGYDASGIEPNTGYAEYSRDILGIPVQIGGFTSARVGQDSLDLVTLFHVAEHLEHPVHALRTIAGWLRKGGRLLVEVPNVESRCIWPSSRFHQAHLYNFNPATLEQAGRRAGLSVVDSFASSDGGNIMCVFEKPEFPDEAAPAPLPGNAAHVRSVLRQHTALSHALTPHPYRRPLQKMRRRREEASATRSANDGKTLLQSIAREIGAKGMRAAQSVPESLFSSDGGGLAGV